MYKFWSVLCFGVFLSSAAFADEVKTDTIKFKKDIFGNVILDTVWIINTNYHVYDEKLHLKLNFSKADPKVVAVNWGDDPAGTEVSATGLNDLEHNYARGGTFKLLVRDEAGNVHHYRVFNKLLSINFDIEFPSMPFRYCLKAKGDSLLIHKIGSEDNPPETKYDVELEYGGTLPYEDKKLIREAGERDLKWNNDSVWIHFEQGTGVNLCRLYLKMSLKCKDKNGKEVTLDEISDERRISVYQVPDVKKIFGFKIPEAGEDGVIDTRNMEVCMGGDNKAMAGNFLSYSEEILKFFQYRRGSGTATPFYKALDDRTDFEIHYWYSDTLPGVPGQKWREVTGDGSMVSTTSEIGFLVSGYYKMMITARNQCNAEAHINADTLYTEKVPGTDKKRYFQVYASNSEQLKCLTDSILCLNATKNNPYEIKIVDYNLRRGFDPRPTYALSPSVEYNGDFVVNEWICKGGKPYRKVVKKKEGTAEVEKMVYVKDRFPILPDRNLADPLETLPDGVGCDSTVFTVKIGNGDYYGALTVNVKKSGACGDQDKQFTFAIGREPRIGAYIETIGELEGEDFLAYHLTTPRYKLESYPNYLRRCDTFVYTFPVDTLLLARNKRGFELDSICFHMEKGGKKERVKYKKGDNKENRPPLTYLFDSTEVLSKMRIVSYNVCGVSEPVEVQLYVHENPANRSRMDLALLRDGMRGNDTLCAGNFSVYKWEWSGERRRKAEDIFGVTLTSSSDFFMKGISVPHPKDEPFTPLPPDGIQYQSDKESLTITETFVIESKGMIKTGGGENKCKTEIRKEVTIVQKPDALLFPDSVSYCRTSPELDTRKLFKNRTNPKFKWSTWELNEGLRKASARFPDFAQLTLVGNMNDRDRLEYTLFQSKGCFRKGNLKLRPQEPPVLDLKERADYCLPDTIPYFYQGESFINAISDYKTYHTLRVYKNEVKNKDITFYREDASNSRTGVKNKIPMEEDWKKLIYLIENTKVDTALMGKCRLQDTVELNVVTPVLKVTDVVDQVEYPWAEYKWVDDEMKRVTNEHIDRGSATWKLGNKDILSAHVGNTIAKWTYNLETEDRKQDTLKFELSARNACGDKVLKDTLFVELKKLKVKGYKHWICSNSGPYTLWDEKKLIISYAKKETVKWDILFPTDRSAGTLAGEGMNATFTPKGTQDSVRILFSVEPEKAGEASQGDTVVLIINSPVTFDIPQDTLWACNDTIKLSKIPDTWYHKANVAKVVRGEYVETWAAGINQWDMSGNNFAFDKWNIKNSDKNVVLQVGLKAKALPGCADVEKKAFFGQLVAPRIRFKRPQGEDMCAGDELKLDTIYTVVGKDRFTKLTLNTGNKAMGTISGDGVYHAEHPEDKIQELKLTAYKEYLCYDGMPRTKYLETDTARLPVTVHRPPIFNVKPDYKKDTLCNGEIKVTVERNWVSVNEGLYPDYQDSVLVNGKKLSGSLEFEMNEGEKKDLEVTVAQGRCTKWKSWKDVIEVFRLPKMLTGPFSVPSVCEGSEVNIDLTRYEQHRLAKGAVWTAEGGTLKENDKKFSPTQNVNHATVSVTLTPPHGCKPETTTVPVTVGRKPHLKKKTYTVCRLKDHEESIETEMTTDVTVTGIDWYRCLDGVNDPSLGSTIQGASSWKFKVKPEYIGDPAGLKLRAVIHATGTCSGNFEDTVQIVWQNAPEGDIKQPIRVCQAADGLNLADSLKGLNYTSEEGRSWSLLTSSATGVSIENGNFLPGTEYDGPVRAEVSLPGLHGCPAKSIPFQVEVLPAPLSGIREKGEHCTRRPVTLQPETPKAPAYTWDFGDGTPASDKGAHEYADKGEYTIAMTAHFANKCTRTETKPWTVSSRPTAAFVLPEYLPLAPRSVDLTSTSSPENVACRWSVDGRNIGKTDAAFTWSFNEVKPHWVNLVVTHPEGGCTDTLEQRGVVVDKPKAEFTVEVDSCSGKVEIRNTSVDNHAHRVSWDFGNGVTEDILKDSYTQNYPVVWQDSIYTITLTLENVSGSSSYAKKVKTISQLKPGFEVYPDPLCEKSTKTILIRTKGRPDTTFVDWGDGKPEKFWRGDSVRRLVYDYGKNLSTEAGRYTIRLRAKNACHEPDPVEADVTNFPQQREAVLLNAMPDSAVCYGGELAFWNKSYGFLPQGYGCEWNFGDGTSWIADTNRVKPVKHRFVSPGRYAVLMRVKDECEEVSDTLSVKVYGNDSLRIAFGKENLCVEDSIRIWMVQEGGAQITDLKWLLGSRLIASGHDTIYYKCNKTGDFTMSLSAKSENCPAGADRSFTVNPTPEPEIDYTATGIVPEGCVPLVLPFRAYNYNRKIGENAKVSWDFGDGLSSQDWIPTAKRYETAGRYVVRLGMTSLAGCVAWDTLTVVAKTVPEVKLELEKNLVCTSDGTFTLKAFNRTVNPDSCSFEWFRKNKSVSILPDSVQFSFLGFFGTEKLSLKAVHKDSKCPGWAHDSVVSSAVVTAALKTDPETVCAGAEVLFIDKSDAEGGTRTLLFDDGTSGVGNEVVKTYRKPGKYTYRFVATNADGCTGTAEDTVYVHTLPFVEFDWKIDNSTAGMAGVRDDVVLPADKPNGGIRFTNLSRITLLPWEMEGLTFRWDFSDGMYSEEKDPVYRFANNGFYPVWLHAFSAAGCRDSVSNTVVIEAIKGLHFPNAVMPAHPDPLMNRFQPKGIGLHAFSLKIYSPTGSCVWQTDKVEDGMPAEYWDGKFNGEYVPAGVYLWKASAVFIDGSVENWLNGAVTVVR